jgi:hypothetical protein
MNFFNKLTNRLFSKPKPLAIAVTEPPKENKNPGILSSGVLTNDKDMFAHDGFMQRVFPRTVNEFVSKDANYAMDDSSFKSRLSMAQGWVPDALMFWYGNQSFIGYQLCAILAQHWLVDKACRMPAYDAVRKGYDITNNDGEEKISAEILNAIKKADIKYRLNEHLVEFISKGKVFGIRIAMFKIASDDPEYYLKPFNIDGVKPGSYKGIVQIDPYWITPELDMQAASDPASLHFYEPTWWQVNGKRIHRTHLIIMRNGEVPDILKPVYFYGGVPVPQKIYERVYAAERTANEAPELALTKRTTALHLDLTQVAARQAEIQQNLEAWVQFKNNYGVKLLGLDEKLEQFDTSLADLDAVIMTQYQLVAAAANVPAVKLLGTSPKGFNATGEFEEASYHEELESLQTHYLTPLIERHHLLLIKSEIAPQFNIAPFSTQIVWKSLDAMTAKEKAELNKLKADTGAVLAASGAIDGQDERKRIIADPDSGYDGLPEEMPENEIDNLLNGEPNEQNI